MQGKIVFALGVAAGYVLGTRVGRKGYEDLKKQANDVLHNPRIQKSVATAADFARENIPVVGDLVGDLSQKVPGQADDPAPKHSAEHNPGSAEQDPGSTDTPGSPQTPVTPDSTENRGEQNA
ncbi:hypothetical protein B0I08_101164 [Glaciihabitans tibetensis]|uniref:YtxH-like protein n=1 Tax=Glaciihabitans tibetensis TaxID=1266600 RepID=A0A2T0VIJ6_9MICO|nr:hypothetical protein [Glaciihabitans tibetensis]PRY70042.1 hypothetical protein B0I08_101164 [Glaciihabitans tibetensis]